MTTNENTDSSTPELTTWQEAQYRSQAIPAYQDNPFIEALPDILSDDDAYRKMRFLPPFSPEERYLPDELRYHAIFNFNAFFKPSTIHLDLQRRISILIRAGYRGRNPMNKYYYKNLTGALGEIKEIDKKHGRMRATAPSFYIVGVSGVGKSTAVEIILSLYPQVIRHCKYKGKPFNFFQIVWLKLNCPLDGSLTGLCISFFQAIDDLLGTNYRKMYASKGSSTLDSMQEDIRRLARLHGIGCLVIDEIQQLSVAKGQGTEMMLNFFVNLVNSAGLSIILIGTPKALPLLTLELQQARRGSGIGDLKWYPIPFKGKDKRINKEWDQFVKTLWKYQYVKNSTDLTEALSEALYQASAGIVDFAIKAFILAQFRAISIAEGKNAETLTPELITSVAADSFSFANGILEMLRNHRYDYMQDIPDLKLFDLEAHFRQILPDKEQKTDLEIIESIEDQIKEENRSNGAVIQPSPKPKEIPLPKSRKPKTKIETLAEISTETLSPDDLRYFLAKSIKSGTSFVDALNDKGYTKDVNEYFG